MSDLLSRNEVMKLVNQFVFGLCKEQNEEVRKTFNKYIEKMPTAYDLGNVVEELKTDSSVKLYGSQNSDNYMIPVNRAIEIVKQGDVSDDVCEWKVKSNYYVTECSHDTDVMYGLKQDFKFCPYCGKKIKVVE